MYCKWRKKLTPTVHCFRWSCAQAPCSLTPDLSSQICNKASRYTRLFIILWGNEKPASATMGRVVFHLFFYSSRCFCIFTSCSMRLLTCFMWLTKFQVMFWICLLVGKQPALWQQNHFKYRYFLFSFHFFFLFCFVFFRFFYYLFLKYLAVLFCINCKWQAQF